MQDCIVQKMGFSQDFNNINFPNQVFQILKILHGNKKFFNFSTLQADTYLVVMW